MKQKPTQVRSASQKKMEADRRVKYKLDAILANCERTGYFGEVNLKIRFREGVPVFIETVQTQGEKLD